MAKVRKGQTFLDIAIQETGNVDNAYSIALANKRSLTSVLFADEDLIIPLGLPVTKKDVFIFSLEKVTQSRVKVLKLQTFLDLAIQYTGTVTNAYSIALANNRSISDTLNVGEMLIIPTGVTTQNKSVEYYFQRSIKPASGLKNTITTIDLEYVFALEFPISF